MFDGTVGHDDRERGRPRPGREDPGAGAGLAVPAGAKVIDLGDATILPGLHRLPHAPDRRVRRQLHPGLLRRAAAADHRAGVLRRATTRARPLEAGFTTVRDVGSDGRPRRRPAQRDRRRPDARPAHARRALRPRRDRAATATTPGFPRAPSARSPASRRGSSTAPNEGRQAVRLDIKYGADVIKMCASGGVLSLGDDVSAPQLTEEELDGDHRRGAPAQAQDRGARARRPRRAVGGQGRHRLDRARLVPDRRDAHPHEVEGHVPRPDLHGGAVDGRQARAVPAARSRPRRRPPSPRTTRCSAAPSRWASRSPSARTRRSRRTARTPKEFGFMVERGMTPAAGAADGGPGRGRAARSRRPTSARSRRARTPTSSRCPAIRCRTSALTEKVVLRDEGRQRLQAGCAPGVTVVTER